MRQTSIAVIKDARCKWFIIFINAIILFYNLFIIIIIIVIQLFLNIYSLYTFF